MPKRARAYTGTAYNLNNSFSSGGATTITNSGTLTKSGASSFVLTGLVGAVRSELSRVERLTSQLSAQCVLTSTLLRLDLAVLRSVMRGLRLCLQHMST